MHLLAQFGVTAVNPRALGSASAVLSLLIPLTGVAFFGCLYREIRGTESPLKTATTLALGGAVVSAVAHAMTFALSPDATRSGAGKPSGLLVGGVVLTALVLGTWLNFLGKLRRTTASSRDLRGHT